MLAFKTRIQVLSKGQLLECHQEWYVSAVIIDSRESAPPGSSVVLQFGEIDCREGFVLAVQKCVYKVHHKAQRMLLTWQDIEEGCLVAVNIYIKALLEVIEKYKYRIYVHPAVPVIDITR